MVGLFTQQGITTSSVLGGGTLSLLDAGKRLSAPGVGLSRGARASLNQFLNQSRSVGNSLLSAGVAGGGGIEGLQTQIRALRSSVPESKLAPSLRPEDSVPRNSNRGTRLDRSV